MIASRFLAMNRIPRRLQADAPIDTLSAQEGHLLQAVDGNLDEQELAFVVGLELTDVGMQLDRFVTLGLISFDPKEKQESSATAEPENSRGEASDAEEGDGIVLTMDARQGIELMHGQLASLNHYELLGLERSATVKHIKKAYYRLAPTFHPDKHFGKELGEYKAKIEAIFTAITRAHDTLRYKKRRTVYDATLPPVHGEGAKGRSTESDKQGGPDADAPPTSAQQSSAPTGLAEEPLARATAADATQRTQAEAEDFAPDSVGGAAPATGIAARAAQPGSGTHARLPRRQRASSANEARREALRRKLRQQTHGPRAARRTQPRPMEEAPEAAYASPEGVPKSAAESLREKFEKAGRAKRAKERMTLEKAGDSAMAQRRYEVAAEAYGRAQLHAPDDAKLLEKLEKALLLADSV